MALTTQHTMSDLDWLSDRISTQVRWFAAGVVGLVWGLLVTPPAALRLSSSVLLVVALLAISVLFFDFLQYAAGYLAVRRLHREILETPGQAVAGFNTRDLCYCARHFFFWTKQAIAILTFIGLIAALVPGFLK
jgi:hypothetical protein